ncbi:MAG: hypothetical protein LBB80_03565 [Treponema sp.]|nr:hypothetical protein [Treponema sp.]
MGVTAGKYHLFKRSRKSGDFYYCWFWQGNERIIKTCGRACTGKREGVAFLEDLLKQEITGTKRTIALQSTTIKGFAKDMFTEGVPHLARWAAKGKVLKRQTIIQPRRHLTACLLPKFGKLRFTEITPTAVEGFLLEQRFSNSCRNTIRYTLKLVMREAKRAGIIEMLPELNLSNGMARDRTSCPAGNSPGFFPTMRMSLSVSGHARMINRKSGTQILP